MKCINMAIEMLGGDISTDFLNPDLESMFVERERLCNKLGGTIRSRQLIADIIVTWCDSNPDEDAVIYHGKEIYNYE